MLTHLKVNNYVLIHENSMQFSNDFNVFTGETGAGKSLLVDALNFVSGQRSSSRIVGDSNDKTRVEAIFDIPMTHKVKESLKSLDLYEQDQLIFSREMTRNGRSTSRINGRAVNLSIVKELSAMIIDIHSQHETQYLLNQKNHLHLFDQYAKTEHYLLDYQNEYQKYRDLITEKETLLNDVLNPESIDFVRFQLKELTDLEPSMKDYTEIEQRLDELENYEQYQSLYNTINRGMDQSLETLYEVLEAFKKSSMDSERDQFQDIYVQLEEFNRDFENETENFSFDEYEFNQLNSRMVAYNRSIRKYGSIESMLNKMEELQRSLEKVDDFEYLLETIEKKISRQKIIVEEKAQVLSDMRRKHKNKLESTIMNELGDLRLEAAVFEVFIDDQELDSMGKDKLFFKVAMNKGSELSPLSQVASGGELSRLMLGLKVIFSKIYGITTVVFDEIDTGVSGKVGMSIGKKMKELAKSSQVISITHLSSVASCANVHYHISKEERDNRTFTNVVKVEGANRIKELAIMMSGSINESSLSTAKKLLEKGQGI